MLFFAFFPFLLISLAGQHVFSNPVPFYRKFSVVPRQWNTSVPFATRNSSVGTNTTIISTRVITETYESTDTIYMTSSTSPYYTALATSTASTTCSTSTTTTTSTSTATLTDYVLPSPTTISGAVATTTAGIESSFTGLPTASSLETLLTPSPAISAGEASGSIPADFPLSSDAISMINGTILVPSPTSPTAYYTTTIYRPTAVVVPVGFYPTFRTATISTLIEELTDGNGYVTAASTEAIADGGLTTTMVSAIPNGLEDSGWRPPGSVTRVEMAAALSAQNKRE